MEHVLIRKLEHLSGSVKAPRFGFAVETRVSAGPAHKRGAYQDDIVWLKLHGGLLVGKAKIMLGWVGEYSSIRDVRMRTRGASIHDDDTFWQGRPRAGYAAVAELAFERWIEPHWAGPRTYGYEWVVLDSDKKKAAWLTDKPPPRGGADLKRRFLDWREGLSQK